MNGGLILEKRLEKTEMWVQAALRGRLLLASCGLKTWCAKEKGCTMSLWSDATGKQGEGET